MILACVAFGGYLFLKSQSLPAPIAAKVDRDLRDLERFKGPVIRVCVRGSDGAAPKPPETRERCEREWIELQADKDRTRFHFARNWTFLVNASVGLLILGWLVGATFVGADWTTRFIATRLMWEPRRTRLFVGSVLAIGVATFAATVLLQLLFVFASLPAALLRGSFQGVSPFWVGSTAATILRGGLVASSGSVMALALGTVSRGTAGALGAGLLFFFLQGPLSTVGSFTPYLMFEGVSAFVGTSLGLGSQLTTLQGGLQIGAYPLAVAVLGWYTFRFRDIAL